MTCHAVFTVALMLYIRENFHPSFVLAEAICPPPPLKANAKPFDESLRYPKGCVIEYGCSKGYVRKSGTSRISVCEEEDGKLVWKDKTTPLECKDPKLCPEIFLTTTTSSIPTSKVQFVEAICPPPPLKANAKPFDESLRYPKGCVIEYGCSKGYVRKSGTSRISVCEEEDGKLVWKDKTTPLECKAKLNAKGDDPKLCPEIFLTTTTSSIPTSKVQFVEDPELCQEIFLTTTTSSIPTSKVQFVEGIRILIGLALLSLLVLIVCIGVKLKKQRRNIQTAQEEEEPMFSVKAC